MLLKIDTKFKFSGKKQADHIFFSQYFFGFLVFPPSCTSYFGPHSLQCYNTIWMSVGCYLNGFGAPTNATASIVDTLNGLNLR